MDSVDRLILTTSSWRAGDCPTAMARSRRA